MARASLAPAPLCSALSAQAAEGVPCGHTGWRRLRRPPLGRPCPERPACRLGLRAPWPWCRRSCRRRCPRRSRPSRCRPLQQPSCACAHAMGWLCCTQRPYPPGLGGFIAGRPRVSGSGLCQRCPAGQLRCSADGSSLARRGVREGPACVQLPLPGWLSQSKPVCGTQEGAANLLAGGLALSAAWRFPRMEVATDSFSSSSCSSISSCARSWCYHAGSCAGC